MKAKQTKGKRKRNEGDDILYNTSTKKFVRMDLTPISNEELKTRLLEKMVQLQEELENIKQDLEEATNTIWGLLLIENEEIIEDELLSVKKEK